MPIKREACQVEQQQAEDTVKQKRNQITLKFQETPTSQISNTPIRIQSPKSILQLTPLMISLLNKECKFLNKKHSQ